MSSFSLSPIIAMLCISAIVVGLIVGAKATITLEQLNQKLNSLEKRVLVTEQQLDQGGKRYQTVPLSKLNHPL